MIKNGNLIAGVKTGLSALRENLVEPMGLSITASDGKFGWGFYKFKALPGHPNPGNAGNGWSHPAFKSNSDLPISAPRDWPRGGSFPWAWETTLGEVKKFAMEIGQKTGFGTDFELECAWENTDRDMTVPGTIGILLNINLLRGGAENYAYYPDAVKNGELAAQKSNRLKKKELEKTTAYMTPPSNANPLIISGAWYVDALPGAIIIELPDCALGSFAISPFRAITADTIDNYSGKHPRKLHGVPVPSTLYPYYNLKKSEETLPETLSESICIRLTPSELGKLKVTADAVGKTVSAFARELVRKL